MPIQYTLIRLGNIAAGYDDVRRETKELMAATDDVPDALERGEPFAIIETTFEGWKVSETRDVTDDVIELAAIKNLDGKTSDDRMPDWVRDTDAYADLLSEENQDRKYGTAAQQQRSDYYAGL